MGSVSLVGAGPGDPGMMTRRGEELLRRADVVLYDRLVDPRLLRLAPPRSERIYVGKESPGRASREAQQRRINGMMSAFAKAGKRVVRLKGGDPYIFGRGGEEGLHLAGQGIPFEVVPGVTAALGAAATTGIPFTHRGVAAEVTFATAHEADGAPPVDWDALGKLRGTIVFYMGTRTLERTCGKLVAAGRRADTPVAVVERATTGRQRTITGTLADIAKVAAEAGVKPPSLVIVGDVVALRAPLDWYERRALFGKRVLSFRPEPDGALESLGAEVAHLPGLEFSAPASWGPVDRALRRLSSFAWVVFTSATAVRFFFERLDALGLDARAFGRAKIAAIGAQTAAALPLRADLVARKATSEGLAKDLKGVRGKAVLLPRADKARDVLREMLRKAGAKLTDVELYRSRAPKPDAELLAELAAGRFQAAVVTSGEIARNVHRWLRGNWPAATKLISIGPVTSEAVRELGWPVAAEAPEPGRLAEVVVEALR